MRRHAPTVLALAGLCVSLGAASPAHALGADAETNRKLGPSDNAGEFLQFPTPTDQWHGCRLTARARTKQPDLPGAPAFHQGNRQDSVTFAVSETQPYVRWRVRPGYRICGVQVSAVLSHPADEMDYLGEVGYTSGRLKGSTVSEGPETIKVPISRNHPDRDIARKMGGKTYAITAIQDVTVFVKRRR